MKRYFKIITSAALLLLAGFSALSQNTSKTLANSYVLHGDIVSSKESFYKQSIESADLEQYRLQDASVELIFKNGFKVELISAKDLTIVRKMQNVNPNNYSLKSSVPKNYTYPVFSILDSGWIVAEMNAVETKIKKQ